MRNLLCEHICMFPPEGTRPYRELPEAHVEFLRSQERRLQEAWNGGERMRNANAGAMKGDEVRAPETLGRGMVVMPPERALKRYSTDALQVKIRGHGPRTSGTSRRAMAKQQKSARPASLSTSSSSCRREWPTPPEPEVGRFGKAKPLPEEWRWQAAQEYLSRVRGGYDRPTIVREPDQPEPE